MNNLEFDVVVVGGGLAGLSAATYAARDGARVALFERSNSVGGRAATSVRSGFHFNRGAHALYVGGPAERVLRELGVAYTGKTPNPANYRVERGGHFHRFVSDTRTLMTSRLLSARERFETARLMMSTAKADLSSLADTTLADWLDTEVRSDVVRAYVESVVRLATFTHDPAGISAEAALGVFQGGSVIFVDGGWQTLVDGLRSVAIAARVQIEAGSGVESVLFERGQAVAVQLAGGAKASAKVVVVAASPVDVARLADDSGSPRLKQWAADSRPVRAAVLDLALQRLPVPNRSVVIAQGSPIYLSVHSTLARLAPDGMALVSMTRYLEPGSRGGDQMLAEMEAFADLVQPGWRELEVDRQYLPSMVVSNREVLASQGGISGRPSFDGTGVANLFVAGDWVGPTGMLTDTVFASARLAGTAAVAAARTTPVRSILRSA